MIFWAAVALARRDMVLARDTRSFLARACATPSYSANSRRALFMLPTVACAAATQLCHGRLGQTAAAAVDWKQRPRRRQSPAHSKVQNHRSCDPQNLLKTSSITAKFSPNPSNFLRGALPRTPPGLSPLDPVQKHNPNRHHHACMVKGAVADQGQLNLDGTHPFCTDAEGGARTEGGESPFALRGGFFESFSFRET